MVIKLLDAIDFFGRGGFLDTHTGTYIPPADYLPMRKKVIPETTTPDYTIVKENPARFLEAPVINQMAVDWHVALGLGIPVETLYLLGFSEEECRDCFFSVEDSRLLRTNGYNSKQWSAIHALIEYEGANGLASEAMEAETNYRQQLMRNWLQMHGISIK